MPKVKQRLFTEDQIRAIAQALGHTEDGLTGAEITDLLHLSNVKDEIPNGTSSARRRTVQTQDKGTQYLI